jgi:hypothetical protein
VDATGRRYASAPDEVRLALVAGRPSRWFQKLKEAEPGAFLAELGQRIVEYVAAHELGFLTLDILNPGDDFRIDRRQIVVPHFRGL